MPEKDRIRNAKRMVLLIANASEYGYITCVYCGDVTHTPQIDHVESRANGGSNKLDNCVVACPTCNSKKKDRSIVTVFGEAVETAVNEWLDTRVLTDDMWSAARTIYRLSYQTEKRIEMVYNWVAKG